MWNNLLTLPKIIRQIVRSFFSYPETNLLSTMEFMIQFLYVHPILIAYSKLNLLKLVDGMGPRAFYSTIYVGGLYKRSLPAATTG